MTDDLDIRVVRGNPTAEELAVVASVLESMTQELEGTKARAAARAASVWVTSQRPIRTPLIPGVSRWSNL